MLPKPFQVQLPILTGILFIAFSLGLCAQNYSVNATVLLAPPYSTHLQDYAQPGNEQLKIILLERDLTQTNFQVRLSFSISLNGKVVMRTSPAFTPVPVELLPNLPTILSGADLADYFKPKNLIFTGIDRDLYLKTKALPEGDVQVCVTAYYFARPAVQVSNQGCSLYYLADNGPPMLSLPRDGDRVPFREPANIIFQWFPGAMGNPTLALNTEYVFELFENRVPGKDPNNVVLTQRPLLTAVSGATNYVYAPTDPALFEGLNYVWRVQVVDKEGKNSFKNNGYSVPYSFTYGGSGPTLFQVGKVQNFRAVAYNESLARLSWKKDTALFDGYRVSYMKEVSLAGWIDDKSPDSVYALSNLLPNTSYLARISGQKGGFYGEVSAIVRFITPSPRVFECKPEEQGLPKADVNNPKLDLVSGDIVNVDGQEMQILKIEHLGGGHYRGMGAMRVALLRNLRFRSVFQDLYIDNKNIVGYGRIDYVSKGVEAFENKQIAKQKTKEGIRDLANQLNGLDTASTSTMLVWAARVALLDESIINETLVLTGDEKQQLLGAKAAIAADVQKLKDNPTDVTAQKNLKKDFQALKAPLQKLSEYMGKGLLLRAGLIKPKIVEEILLGFEKDIETYLSIPESERNSTLRKGPDDEEVSLPELPVCLQGKTKEEVKDINKNKIASILKDSTKLFSFTDGLVSSEPDLFASAEKQVNAGYVASKTKSLSEVIKADDYNRVAKVVCEALIAQALIYDLSTATKIDKSRPEIEGEVTHDKDDPKNLCGEYLVFEDIKYDIYCPPKNKKPCSKLFQTEEEYYQYVATRLIYSDKLGCKNLKIPDDYYLDATFFEIRSKLLKTLNWEPAFIFKIAYWIDGISTDNLNHQRDEEARKLFDQLFSGNIALQQQAVATIREKDFIRKTGDIAAMYFESEFGGYIVGKLGGLVIKSPFFKNMASYVGSKVVAKSVPKVIRTLEELAPGGIIPKNAEFNNWFDDLSQQELENLLNDKNIKGLIEKEIRSPGGYHEWCMVCEVEKFKSWSVSMYEIQRFRTLTVELKGINPTNGEAFAHSIKTSDGKIISGPGSKTFHNELRAIINSSNSLNEFNNALMKLIDRWKINPNLLPPLPTAK